jgi:Tol biopolymer transport system component/N-acetylneuraminic acid mutarotase
VNIRSVTIGGQTYTTNQPTFTIQVTERRYAHSWSYGAVRTASAGVGTGIIAYLGAETNGGLGLTLEESDPYRTADDRVSMEENYSVETNTGVGLGIRERIRAGVVKADLDASVTTERKLRHFGALEAEFNQPYAENDRKAQGIFLALSVLDSALGVPIQPLVVGMLRVAEAQFPYLDYISAQSVGTAAKVTPLRAHIGAEMNLAASRRGSAYKERTVGFTLLDVGVSRLVAEVLTDYGDEYSVGFDDELSLDLTLLTPHLPGIRNQLIGVIGDRAVRLHKEYFFDSATDSLKRIELTLTGEGNPYAFTDVIKKVVSVRMMLEGANLTPSLVERVGQAQVIFDLNALLSAVPQIPYSVEVEDGSFVSFVPEIDIPGTEISVGFGLEVEKTRNLVRERGVFLNGKRYLTESYSADALVSRPGKSWWDLTVNALGGLWLLVRDAFNWVSQQVTSGIGWVIGTVSRTVQGAIQGGARIIAPPGTQLYARSFGPQGITIQQTTPITVTAIGWVPEATGAGALSLRPELAAASGAGFVVGGIYEFQPYTLTLSPAASLVITYTNEAAAGLNESRIGMFRWDPEGNHWQPMAAISDTAHNVFTATITQLGTFALGYDSTPPQITFLEPTNGSIISNTLPRISALVVDTGVGIDPRAVVMWLDGQMVAATYITGTGELVYLPTVLLEAGQHTVQVSASDALGNVSSATATFTVRPESHIYLPLMLRSRTDHAPTATWSTRAPMSVPRDRPAAVALDGKIYVMGGTNSTGALASMEVYDPATNTWTTKASMPGPKSEPGAAVANGRIYVVGPPDDRLYEYNPNTDTWETRAPLPATPAGAVAVASISGRIFVTFAVSGESRWRLYVYDPFQDTWERRSDHPDDRRSIASLGVSNGMIYAVGGGIAGQTPQETTRIDRYDPSSDQWTVDAIPPIATRRTHLGATLPTIYGKMFVFGGWNGHTALANAEVYDPWANAWSALPPMPTARYKAAYAAVGYKIYVIGGNRGDAGGHWLATNEELSLPEPAQPENPIAFVSDRDGYYEIYTMNPDGSRQLRITNDGCANWHANWSPDGKRILFAVDCEGNFNIYSMSADGSDWRRLTTDSRNEFVPAQSPDGQRIAYLLEEPPLRVYVMNSDGSSARRLTTGSGGECDRPAWSPDSSRIAFCSTRSGDYRVYIMNADGTNVVRLTNHNSGAPQWSWVNNKIVYHGDGRIYSINPDGTGFQTLSSKDDWFPFWSADGNFIVFHSWRDGGEKNEIYVMNANGGSQRRLTRNNFMDWEPAWGGAITR